MIRVLLFKLKTWYGRAKVEYEESKIVQKMYPYTIRKFKPLSKTFQRKNPFRYGRPIEEKTGTKTKFQKISKKRVKKMARKMLEANERTSTK